MRFFSKRMSLGLILGLIVTTAVAAQAPTVPKRNPADPATWLEIFDPDRECTVRGLHLSRITDAQGRPLDPAGLVRVVQLQPNPDYPRTTPRGGTGRGHLVP